MDLKSIGEFLFQNKEICVSLILFVILFVYHKSQVKLFERLLDQQQKREAENFEFLKSLVETLQYHGNLITEIKGKIETNQFCPFMRKNAKDLRIVPQES